MELASPFEQTLNPASTESTWNLVKIIQVVSEEKLFNNIIILLVYTAQRQGKISLAEYNFDCNFNYIL